MRAAETQTPGGNRANAENQSSSAADLNAAGEPEATVIAKLAFAGHVVHRGKCCDWTVSKWGMSYYAQDLDALTAFARKLGVCE